jgi:hypothetical protein
MMASTSSSCCRSMGLTLTVKGTFAVFLCYICTSADRMIVEAVVLVIATHLVQTPERCYIGCLDWRC